MIDKERENSSQLRSLLDEQNKIEECCLLSHVQTALHPISALMIAPFNTPDSRPQRKITKSVIRSRSQMPGFLAKLFFTVTLVDVFDQQDC